MKTPLWHTMQELMGKNFLQNRELHRQIQDLSHMFTEGRKSLNKNYLENPQTRDAYLSYYVPLNFNKILLLLDAHGPAEAPSTILDFGCGPGTATLAYMQWLVDKPGRWKPTRKLTVHLVDSSSTTLKLANQFIESFAEELGIVVETQSFTSLKSNQGPYDLAFVANVLNELKDSSLIENILNHTSGDFLIIEPSHRVSSQKLIRLRERILKNKTIPFQIVGPCTHAEKCPIAETKHWCHFSEPLHDQDLIYLNQKVFRNPRFWLKFSYLYLRRKKSATDSAILPLKPGRSQHRAIGDLHPSGPGHYAIDLCAPNEKRVFRMRRKDLDAVTKRLVRGALVTLDGEQVIKVEELS